MSSNTEPEYITIGTIAASRGLQGHIKVNVETDFPQRFSTSSKVYIDKQVMIIDGSSWHKGQATIKLQGVDTEEEAERLIGRTIEIHHSQLFNLEEDVYFHFQLVGLDVITTGGDTIGTITDILSMASADIYVIKGMNGEILIPATDEVIKSVNLDKRTVIIEPMDGLLGLNEKKRKNN